MDNKYLSALEGGLKKKAVLLDELIVLTEKQKEIISSDKIDWDQFYLVVDEKAKLVDTINKDDEGFNAVFNRIKDEIVNNKEQYKANISSIQESIKLVTEKSTNLQALEMRNKVLIENAFNGAKQKVAQNKVSTKAAAGYYNSMNKINLVDPQLMDKKK